MEIIMEHPGPWLCWVLPLIGALLMPLFAMFGDKVRDYLAVAFAGSAVIAAFSMVPSLLSGHLPGDIQLAPWVTFPGGNSLSIGVLVDPLSVIICNVVAFISFLIVIYSVGYMHGDPNLTRYWFFFLFFIGNMLLLVVSDNLLQLLIGWEGVGLCSYTLIGYYYRDAKERWLGGPPPTKMFPPSECGMKAFVVTGVGDVLILAAVFIIFNFAGTLNFVELIQTSPEWLGQMAHIPGLIGLTSILFLGGPIGKSAQFPLHEWLPEAMAGPTAVSALIHAATMVKAGVYLVARMSPVFYIGTHALHLPEAQWYFITIAFVGGFTAFLAASQAIVNIELKKVLAYSTVSQIGYMMLGLGVSGLTEGAYIPGLTSGVFHLASHALFKAALFLCAGSVIHAVESIYMFNMGGLKRHMPKTYWLMVIATLSLSGIPPLSGFWSKDSVFLASIVAGTPYSMLLLGLGAISAAMTFTYSIRYIIKTFHGEESDFIHELEGHGHHIHEAPTVMWGPIAILVALVVIVGIFGLVGVFNPTLSPEVFIEEQMHHMLHDILPHGVELRVPHPEASTKLLAVGTSAAMLLLGGVVGWVFYLGKRIDPWQFVTGSELLSGAHTFLWNRWYMNQFYYAVFVDGVLMFKQYIFDGIEQLIFGNISDIIAYISIAFSKDLFNTAESGVINGLINRDVPDLFTAVYHKVKKLQTGVLSYNIMYMALFLIALFIGLVLLR
ncbi:MAG: NADH-quinone oxidoreductase subunit L [Candidatus Bathyarchaeia archaeon]